MACIRQQSPVEELAQVPEYELPKEGKEREALVRIRVNQNFFRRAVFAAYNAHCCITGLSIPELLNASHIVPWAVDPANRVNPKNGLCLNALHDRAFDRGLLTVTPNMRVKVAPVLKSIAEDNLAQTFLLNYDNKPITLPERFAPDPDFLKFHNETIFQG
ncbi:MAG: HNH endonuclease [Anaerolineae bacterium]|nr:HNH endonuclease [Anaerolineae bacterium]